jgi:ABC-type nitrate/sulfonate/bicarbonate transport system permease component
LPLGIAMGWWRRARWIAFPLFQVLRPIPPLAWIPLAIVWLGIGEPARIFVVFVAALVPWVMNSMQAVHSIDGLLVRAARTLGASDRQILTRVVCRTALPTLVAGARIALGNAWTTLIAAELLAATSGLGYIALNASRTLEMGILLVSMLVIGVLGAAFSFGMQALARVFAPWSRGART